MPHAQKTQVQSLCYYVASCHHVPSNLPNFASFTSINAPMSWNWISCPNKGNKVPFHSGRGFSTPFDFDWLVVLTILKNMKVNGTDDIPYIMENKIHAWNHQPVIHPLITLFLGKPKAWIGHHSCAVRHTCSRCNFCRVIWRGKPAAQDLNVGIRRSQSLKNNERISTTWI